MLLLISLALAAPPSSRLTGPKGTLAWTVSPSAAELRIEGTSPEWKVTHTAGPDFAPRKTVLAKTSGETITVVFTPTGADVTKGGKTTSLAAQGLWDGETLDVRLGALVAAGKTSVSFQAIDLDGVKVYTFDATHVGREQCGATPCDHQKVQLAGMLRFVGPTWEFWYGPDGKLLKFLGPLGDFAAEGAR